MNSCFITFHSLTATQRGEIALRKSNLYCAISRTPRWMEEQGCGSGLKVRCRDISSAITRLKAERIPYRKVYLRSEDGTMEELEV